MQEAGSILFLGPILPSSPTPLPGSPVTGPCAPKEDAGGRESGPNFDLARLLKVPQTPSGPINISRTVAPETPQSGLTAGGRRPTATEINCSVFRASNPANRDPSQKCPKRIPA